MSDNRAVRPISDQKFYSSFLQISKRLENVFINRTPLISVGPKKFTVTSVVAAAIQSKVNMYLIGSRGSGKTLLAETAMRSVFNNDALYLRGDMNLLLKDLYTKLNLDGKTDEEIHQMAEEKMRKLLTLVDELNRVPGILQNQLLNIADGYIEIRGKRYTLGTGEYMLMIATGNPPSNGDHPGVFDEDLALLDRIPLIINVDEVPLVDGDMARISMGCVSKEGIPTDNLQGDVLSSYRHVVESMNSDPVALIARSMLAEMLYDAFLYVSVGGRRVDKIRNRNWRDKLTGQHEGGLLVSYCSDIPRRTIVLSQRLAFATHKIAEVENTLLRAAGKPYVPVGMKEFIDAYFESLKLAMNYDRRFIPEDLPEQLNKSHGEMLSGAFDDVRKTIDEDAFGNAVIYVQEFNEALNNGNEAKALAVRKFVEGAVGKVPLMRAAQKLMDSEMEVREERRQENLLGFLAREAEKDGPK